MCPSVAFKAQDFKSSLLGGNETVSSLLFEGMAQGILEHLRATENLLKCMDVDTRSSVAESQCVMIDENIKDAKLGPSKVQRSCVRPTTWASPMSN